MKHYRQIIINIEVEDDLPEQKLEELVRSKQPLKKVPIRMKLRLMGLE